MIKVFVVYDTKYGNTKLVAETIVEGDSSNEKQKFISDINSKQDF